MTLIKTLACLTAGLTLALNAQAEQPKIQGFVHEPSNGYEWPTDPAVLDHLDRWQDQKFGVLFHWGLYSVPGIVESWSICSEDVDWINRPNSLPYDEYKQWYFNLQDSLVPTQFDPAVWADIMKDAGMKYMLFTTKHHDGFCMYDSKYDDFSIAKGPFASDPRSDVARHVFDAFRDKDFMIGAYFSKPDWHTEWYWNPAYSTPNRHQNYKKERHPEWWQNYKDLTYNQLNELMTEYGDFDILWLDGGWVTGEQVGLDSLLAKVRSTTQPGLIAVDRSIRGRNENYQTPERGIPERQQLFPWESCITLSNDWGWVPNAPYKSPQHVIALLTEIVAKGGCFVLGVGPTAQGTIEQPVVDRLQQIGKWLRANGKAIYATRPTPNYNDGQTWFTADKNGRTLYAIYVVDDEQTLPATIQWTGNRPKGKMRLLSNGKTVNYTVNGDKVTVTLPKGLPANQSVALEFESLDARPVASLAESAQPLYKQAAAPVDARVADLVARMTLDEKLGQLRCPLGWEMYTKQPDGTVTTSELFRTTMEKAPLGSIWAVLRADPWTQKTLETGLNPTLAAEALNAMQRYATEQTRLGIPILFAEEAPHGHMAIGATVFPTSLSQASTWDRDLIYRMGQAIGQEVAAQGGNIGYGPVLDIAREPRWSRVEETFGEDPVLTSKLGVAFMNGMQQSVGSTLKHFAAYGVPEAGLNGGPTKMGMIELFSEYLPPFKEAVKNGAASIMSSYNTIDGVPCTSNEYLLSDVLRDQWGFNGFVYSDLISIDGLTSTVAANKAEAGALALKAGVDIDLGANVYGDFVKQALEQGLVTEADIDRAVANVLRTKFSMGLFENPYVDAAQAAKIVRSASHKQTAREVARKGTVLLKNDGTLPLSKSIGTLAVIGPNADMMYNQLGDYTAPQDSSQIVTVLEGIRSAVGPQTKIVYAKGCAIRDTTATDIPAAVRAAEQADAVVLVVGGSSARDFKTKYAATGAAASSSEGAQVLSDMECGEGMDRATLSLLGDQEKLINAVAATGKPLVIVYIQGRPLNMNLASEKASALLNAWYPGEQGGNAIADIIFGDYNPSGRLSLTIPRHEGQIPIYYSQGKRRDVLDMPGTPLYAFGHGLSYTTFAYSDLKLTPGTTPDVLEQVSCTVTNTGSRAGEEVVQLYVTDEHASVAQPALLLKDFVRVDLAPGESRTVTFDLGPDQLAIYNAQLKQVVEPGAFKVMVGPASDNLPLQGRFILK